MGGELVQECIRSGAVRLTRTAENARHAREPDEKVQITVPGCPVEVPRPEHDRCQHLLDPVSSLACWRAICQQSDAVERAFERRQGLVHANQHRIHLDRDRHILQFNLNRQTWTP